MGNFSPGVVVVAMCHDRESHQDKNTACHDAMDEVIKMKDNVRVGPFQAEILKGRVTQAPAQDAHVMVVPIRHADMVCGKARPLPPGLQVLHVYTMLTAGSKQVLIVV